jgi:hypothetical protein
VASAGIFATAWICVGVQFSRCVSPAGGHPRAVGSAIERESCSVPARAFDKQIRKLNQLAS